MNKKANLVVFILYMVAAVCMFVAGILEALVPQTTMAIVFICCGCADVICGMVHLARLFKSGKSAKQGEDGKVSDKNADDSSPQGN